MGEKSVDYLINGVFVKTNRIAIPKDKANVDEIALHGESKTSLECISKLLNLPDIPEESFVHHSK